MARRKGSALRLLEAAAQSDHATKRLPQNKVKADRDDPEPRRDGASEYLQRLAAKSRHQLQQVSSRPQGLSLWDTIGAGDLKQALLDTVLVDAAWLAALADNGEVLPRCQAVPDAARVTLEEMEAWSDDKSETVGVLVVSYAWLDIHHPDPHGEQLQNMAFVFRAFAGSAAQKRKGCRVGVFLDVRRALSIPRLLGCPLAVDCPLARPPLTQ
jgi:hypothetical protein